MKILVIRLGAFGDIIRTLPAVKYLYENIYQKNIEIHWLLETHNNAALQDLSYISKIIQIPRKDWQKRILSKDFFSVLNEFKNIVHILQANKYDLVIDFHGIFKSGLFSFLSGTSLRLGYTMKYSKEFNFIFNNIRISAGGKIISRYKRNFLILSYFKENIIMPDEIDNIFEIGENEKNKINAYLNDISISSKIENPIIIGIQPAVSAFGHYKEWSEEKFSELTALLLKKNKSIILIHGRGRDEYEKAKRIINSRLIQDDDKKRIFYITDFSLKETAYIFSRCSLFITGDTGPMHIAALAGTNIIALFGPSDITIAEPFGKKHKIINFDSGCNPCRNHSCKKRKCMDGITPEMVMRKIEEMIKKN